MELQFKFNDGWKFVRRNLKPLGEPSEIRVWRIK